MVRRQVGFAITVLLVAYAAHAQTAVPTMTFTFSFPGSQPDHYVISVSGDGHARYESDGKLSSDADSTPYQRDFNVSPEFRSRLFDLAKRTHYFSGEIDSKKKGIASTGIKTLAYKDGQKSAEASYNYSPNPAVQELTGMFQGLANTLEFGHRLEYYHRYQKLALADELKRMEDTDNGTSLQQVNAVSDILRRIAEDQSVINVVRMRAERLLQKAASH